MNRYDTYALIHKGLRACLAQTLVDFGRTDPHSDAALAAALTGVRELLALCRGHLEHEDEFIHPAMEAREPGSARDMYAHHEQHEAMIGKLQVLTDEVERADLARRAAAAAALYRALALFVADNLAHMHEEETANNGLLWRHYSDAEIQAIERRLVQSIPHEDHDKYMRWMLSAMNHQERRCLLGEMRAGAPEPVFRGTLELARSSLSAPEWTKLELAMAC